MAQFLPRLKHPVVLAHGLLGFGEMKLGGARLSYFKILPAMLEASGNRFISSGVPPTGSIARRAEQLKRNIGGAFGDTPVHLITHSMGGLDSRHMITHLGMAGRVASLTMFGTPHRGSSFADWLCEHGDKTRTFEFLVRLGLDMDAFKDLRRSACAGFNLMTPDAPGVRYFSNAGDKPLDRTLYLMRPSHKIITAEEGPNDGLVAVESTRWGESFDVWDCDHVNLVGWTSPLERARGFFTDPAAMYEKAFSRIQAAEL